MDNTLEARGVVKRFAGHTALDGVSVEVRPGRVFGLLGPNGAGKTTLIRIINRITMPDADLSMQILSVVSSLPLAEIAVLFVLYFIGGYLLYASVLAGFGAAVNDPQDTQQFMMPIAVIMLFAFYAGFYSAMNPDGPLAVWCSFIPLTSPMVMMIRIPFGVPLWQEALSVALLFGTALALSYLSGKIYRVGILMYGKKPSLKEMLKWLKY